MRGRLFPFLQNDTQELRIEPSSRVFRVFGGAFGQERYVPVVLRVDRSGQVGLYICGHFVTIEKIVALTFLCTPSLQMSLCKWPRVDRIDLTQHPHVNNLRFSHARGSCPARQKLPPRLERTWNALTQKNTIYFVSKKLKIKESTAFTYVYSLVQHRPETRELALNCVGTSVWEALMYLLREEDDALSGPLRDLVIRVEKELEDDINWQNKENKMARVSLARLLLAKAYID